MDAISILKQESLVVPQTKREINRAIATKFVNKVNQQTLCQHCGTQPIEWHHADHPKQPNARVSSLRTQGSSIRRIQQEMDRCTPLCRSCHMAEDGRTEALLASTPNQKGVVLVGLKPCIECEKPYKPLRKGRCWTCSEKYRCGGRFHTSCDGCCSPPPTKL